MTAAPPNKHDIDRRSFVLEQYVDAVRELVSARQGVIVALDGLAVLVASEQQLLFFFALSDVLPRFCRRPEGDTDDHNGGEKGDVGETVTIADCGAGQTVNYEW